MNAEQLAAYVKHPEKLDRESIQGLFDLVDQYPFFQTGYLLLLKNLHNLNYEKFPLRLKQAAPFISDRKRLYILLNQEASPEQETAADTEEKQAETTAGVSEKAETIPIKQDTEVYQQETSSEDPGLVEAEIQTLQDNYLTYDVLSTIDKEPEPQEKEEQPARQLTKEDELIASFLQKDPKIIPEQDAFQYSPGETAPQQKANPPVESFATERLAAIYLKQQLFDKALQIYKKLLHDNPQHTDYYDGKIKEIEKQREV